MAREQVIKEATQRYLLEGSPMVRKWGTKINEVNRLLKEDNRKPLSVEAQTALARILENTQQRINFDLREATQNTMVGPYKRYAMDVILGMFPNLIALDLVNVQPIDNKVGIINYVKYSAGSNKGSQVIGDPFATTFNYTGSHKNYTAQQIDEMDLTFNYESTSTKLDTILAWKPVVQSVDAPVVIKVVVGSSTLEFFDKADGKIYRTISSTDTEKGTIDYATGKVSITDNGISTEPTSVTAAWFYNNEYAPADVPEINLSIESIMVRAQSRKLRALWSFDASFELQKEYGQDLNALLAAQAAAEIAHEIDQEICDDLYDGAFVDGLNPVITWDATAPYGVAQSAHFESFRTALNKASNRIYQNTKRAMGNFVIVGSNVATVLESTPSFDNKSDLGNNVGPYFLGNWGGFKIYKNPFFDPDKFLVGFKGNSLFDAGYAYCPYMPVSTTQMLMTSDFMGQQGWATSYGKTMLNDKMYVPGTITGLV